MKNSCKQYALTILLALLVLCSGIAVLFGCSVDAIEEKRTVTFMNGEEVFDVQEVDLGEKYSFPDEIPTREQPDDEHMCKFLGWTLDPNFYEYRSEILEEPDYVVGDITIYAAFRTVAIATEEGAGADLEYNVEFRMPRGEDFGEYAGKTLKTEVVKRYGSAALPTDEEMPQIAGYHFTGNWEGGTLQDVRGHRRVTAVYEKNIYSYTWHYLDKTRTVEVEFRHEIDLTETPETDQAFVFDGWYTDASFSTPATLTEVPAGNVDLYAKYRINFSTASVSREGEMVYGDTANKLYVSGLNYYEGLEYSFVWTVNGGQGERTENSVYPLKNAGGYAVGVHIFADYKNGILKDEGDAKDADGSSNLTFTLQKATLTAEVTLSADKVVYGQPAPAASIVYSGFKFDETAEDVGVDQDFVYMLGDTNVTGENLHAGNYRVETVPHALNNYNFATIAAPQFEVTKKALNITFTVSNYEYGTGFAPEISFEGFEYADGRSVLGEHWFEVGNFVLRDSQTEIFRENDLIHAGDYFAQLQGFASQDYAVNLPSAENFSVAKRKATATLQAEGGVYGVTPQVDFTLYNVLEQDEERFTAEYAYKRGGNGYTSLNRFIVGTYTVSAKFTENGSDYEPLDDLTEDFAITKADLHIGVAVEGQYTYGDSVSPETTFVNDEFKFGESPNNLMGTGKYVYHTAAEPQAAYNGRLNVGSYTVEIMGYSADNYNIIYGNASFKVTQKSLTLSVRLQNTGLLYGDTPRFVNGENIVNGIEYSGFAYEESATSVFDTLPNVSYFKAGTTEPANDFHAGKYTATTSAEASNYNITVVPVDFTVAKRTLYIGIQLKTENTLEYGQKPRADIVYEKEGYDGFRFGEIALFTSSAAILYDGATDYYQSELTPSSAKMVVGKYDLSVTGIDAGIDRDYDVTYRHIEEPISFEITPKKLTATIAKDKGEYTYGDKPVLALNISGWVYGENETDLFKDDSRIITVNGGQKTAYTGPQLMDAGDYITELAEVNNPNYSLDITAAQFTINKKLLTFTVAMDNFEYGSDKDYTITHNGFIEGENEDNLIGELKVDGLKTGKHYSGGSHTLTLSGYESNNYEITYNSATFNVSKKPLTFTIAMEGFVYGSDNEYTITPEGFIEGENEENLTGELTVSDTGAKTGNHYNAGSHTLTLSGYKSNNYEITYNPATFYVSKKPLEVSVTADNITYGENLALSAPAYKDFAEGEDAQNLNGGLVYTYKVYKDSRFVNAETSASGFYRAGYYTLTLSGYESNNYEITYNSATFTVAQRNVTVTMNDSWDKYANDRTAEKDGYWYAVSGDEILGSELTFSLSITHNGEEYTHGTDKYYPAGTYDVAVTYEPNPDYSVSGVFNKQFTVAQREVTLTMNEGWTTYADDRTAEEGYWYTVAGDEIVDGELTFNLSITHDGEKYEHGTDPYYPVGEYVVTVSHSKTANYKVQCNNSVVEEQTSVSFNVAKKPITISVDGGSEPWAARADWSYTPIIGDSRFTLEGVIVLNNSDSIHAATYNETEIDKTFKWQEGFSIKAGNRDVKDNFEISYILKLILSNSSFSIQVPQNLNYTYDAQEHSFPVTATADGISAEAITREYSVGDEENYGSGVPAFTDAGEYTVYYRVSAPDTETELGNFTVKISPKALTVNKPTKLVYVYDGGDKFQQITVNGVQGTDEITVKYAKDGITFGEVWEIKNVKDEYKTVHFKLVAEEGTTLSNYALNGKALTEENSDSYTITINPAQLKKPAADNSKFAYDATPKTYKLEWDEGTMTFNGALTQTNAGEYQLTVGIKDKDNYVWAEGGAADVTYTFTIAKANLTVTVTDINTQYDGADKFQKITVNGLQGEDNITVRYSKNGRSDSWGEPWEIKNVNEEYRTVYFQLIAEEGTTLSNYTLNGAELTEGNSNSYTITITPKPVTVTVIKAEDQFQYDKKAHGVIAQITVTDNLPLTGIGTPSFILNGSNKSQNELVATNAGDYEVKISVETNGNYAITVNGGEFTFTIKPKAVITPTSGETTSFKYSGSLQTYTPAGYDNDAMTITGNTFTDVPDGGSQTATVALKDKNNYVWAEGGTADVTYTFTIAKAEYNVDRVSDITGVYNAAEYGRSLEELKSLVSVYGSDEFEVEFTTDSTAVNVGTITVTYKISGNDNYNDRTDSYTITINKAEYTVTAEDQNYKYNANVQGKPITVKGVDNAEVEGAIVTYNGKSSVAQYKDYQENGYTVNYTVAETQNYNAATGSYTITIERATPRLKDNTGSKTYSPIGGLLTEDIVRKAVIESGVYSDATVTFEITDGQNQKVNDFAEIKNAGVYTVKVSVSGNNYNIVEVKTYTFTIARATLTRPAADNTQFTYNGALQTYNPQIAADVKAHVTVNNNTMTDAGTQNVEISINDKTNYEWSTEKEGNTQDVITFPFTIAKANLTVTLPTELEYPYDGGNHFQPITVTGIQGEDEYTVMYQKEADWGAPWAIINVADTCTVHYRVQANTTNYIVPDDGYYEITINPAQLTKPTADTRTFEYNTQPQTYTFGGFDDQTMLLSGDGLTQTNAKTYKLTVAIKDKANYVWAEGGTDDVTYNFIIAKKTLKELPDGVSVPTFGEQVNKLGKTLKGVSLTSGFSWADETTPLQLGENGYNAYYNPDPANYNNFDVTITFSTRRENVKITATNGFDFDFGVTKEDILNRFTIKGEDGRDLSVAEKAFINITLTGVNLTVGSTYLAGISLKITDKNNYFSLSGDTSLSGVLLKIKSVEGDGKLYTIEDALNTAQSGKTITVKNNTSFATQEVAAQAGYNGNDYYTVKTGVTLLLPYSESDNEGFIHPTWEKDADTSNLPSNASGKNLYITLTIPKDIVITNCGTLTVGAFTGQKDTGHIGGISGGYAEVKLDGTLSSSGTLNVYGNITGVGSINATAGTVIERMEICDWPGGSAAGGRFTAKNDKNFDITSEALKLMFGGEIKISDPNEFPFEEYWLQAINGPTLTIFYGTTYAGNVRIFTSQQSQAGVTVPPMLSIANLNISNRDSDSADALFKLKNGSTFGKKVVNSREQITITGGFIGGKCSIIMNVMKATINMDSSKVKFPISKQIDLILDGGNSTSAYGYEFMSGSTLSLTNGATLQLNNSEDGTIVYEGAYITVGANCELTLTGKFGGKIKGKEGANLMLDATDSNSGYIGGTGKRDGTTFSFTGTATTVSAQGVNGDNSTLNLSSNSVYVYHNNAWVATNTQFAINYNYVFKDAQGNPQTETLSPVNGNPAQHSYDDGTIELSPATCEGWTFIGWFTNESCEEQYSIDKISDTMLEEITLYGLFQKVDAYVITYNLGYPDGYSLPEGKDAIVIGSETVIAKDLLEYDPAKHNNAVQVYDYDPNVQYYFGGWYVDSSYTKVYSAENLKSVYGEAIGSTSVTLYAKWEKKVTLTVNYSAQGKDGKRNSILGRGGYAGNTVTLSVSVCSNEWGAEQKGAEAVGEGGKEGYWDNSPEGKSSGTKTITIYLKEGQHYEVKYQESASGGSGNGDTPANVATDGALTGTAGKENITVTITAT